MDGRPPPARRPGRAAARAGSAAALPPLSRATVPAGFAAALSPLSRATAPAGSACPAQFILAETEYAVFNDGHSKGRFSLQQRTDEGDV